MTDTDKARIEKEAEAYANGMHPVETRTAAKIDYRAGATSENERMAEQFRQERNKAIDEALERKFGMEGPHGVIWVVRVDELESLKSKP